MASFQRKSIDELNLTYISVTGDLIIEEVLDELEDLYSSPPVTMNMIWDIRKANLKVIPKASLKTLSDSVKRKISVRSGGKTAIITKGDTNFGLGRMYEIYCDVNKLEISISIFKNPNEALDWIKED